MKKTNFILAVVIVCMLMAYGCSGNNSKADKGQSGQTNETGEMPKVYFTKEITPEALMKIYKALGREAKGNNVVFR